MVDPYRFCWIRVLQSKQTNLHIFFKLQFPFWQSEGLQVWVADAHHQSICDQVTSLFIPLESAEMHSVVLSSVGILAVKIGMIE